MMMVSMLLGVILTVFTAKNRLPKHKYRIDEDNEKHVIRLTDNERIPLIQVDGKWGWKTPSACQKLG